MAISDDERAELRALARASWGERGADLLMTGLHDDRDRLERRIDDVETRLGARIDGLRTELKADIADLRGEFADLRGEFGDLRGEFGRLEGRVLVEVAGIRTELANQTRALWFAVVGTVVAIAGIAFSAFQLGATG